MKKIIFCLLLLLSNTIFSQDFFIYKISKPYCIWNFMETATNGHATSSTLKKFIEDKTKDNLEFQKLCEDYKKIKLDYSFKRSEFPNERKPYRSTIDLISINAVNSKNLIEFDKSIIGILPIAEQQKFVIILKKSELIYNQIIWNVYEKKLILQKNQLSKFKNLNVEIFDKFNHFYNSTWTNKTPFIVALYPIPGKNGYTIATPHGNSLCVGVLTDETHYSVRNGVIVHEMCHVLYDEQSSVFQKQLVTYFANNKSSFSSFASAYFDEGLATALGNGWAYKKINGKLDQSEWYNNKYIEGFARAIFPLTEKYISENEQIDNDFIDKAIELFSIKFPNANSDYSLLFNKMNLYYDNLDENEITNPIRKYFQNKGLMSSSPILDPIRVDFLKNSKITQLIVIDEDQKNTLAKLKEIFSEISAVEFENKPLNLSFYSKNNVPIVILIVNNKSEIENEINKINKLKFFDKSKIVQF